MQKEVGSLIIGVLALQGGVNEHVHHIESIGCKSILVKNALDLSLIDGLIIPGGESTTISKLLKLTNLDSEIIQKAKQGLPIWGTCAGMILLSKEIENDENGHLSLINIRVKRNAYGRQIDSFVAKDIINSIDSSEEFPMVFIRAPYVSKILSSQVEILASIDNNIVAVREGNILATSFHPELTSDLRFHKYFIDICIKNRFN